MQLQEIENLINKKIEIIKVSKNAYDATVQAGTPETELVEELKMSFSELIEREEALLKKNKKSKSKNKNRK